jgi:hypothetical protein
VVSLRCMRCDRLKLPDVGGENTSKNNDIIVYSAGLAVDDGSFMVPSVLMYCEGSPSA